jgi:hypothetical protein
MTSIWPAGFIVIPSTKFHGKLTTGSLFDLVWPRWPQCHLDKLSGFHPPSFTAIRYPEVFTLYDPMTSMWPREFIAIPSTKFHGNPTTGSSFDLVWPRWPQCDLQKFMAIPSPKFHGNPTNWSLFDLTWCRWPQCDLEKLLRSHPLSSMAIWQQEVHLTLYDPDDLNVTSRSYFDPIH